MLVLPLIYRNKLLKTKSGKYLLIRIFLLHMLEKILRNIRIVSLTSDSNFKFYAIDCSSLNSPIPNWNFSYFNSHIRSVYLFLAAPFQTTKVFELWLCETFIRHNYIFCVSHKDSINLLIRVLTSFLISHNF